MSRIHYEIVRPSWLNQTELSQLDDLRLQQDDSDMTMLLRDIKAKAEEMDGKCRLALARHANYLVGWSSVEQWQSSTRRYRMTALNCYVDIEHRGRGIGTELVRLLSHVYREVSTERPSVDVDALDFYRNAAPELFTLRKAS